MNCHYPTIAHFVAMAEIIEAIQTVIRTLSFVTSH